MKTCEKLYVMGYDGPLYACGRPANYYHLKLPDCITPDIYRTCKAGLEKFPRWIETLQSLPPEFEGISELIAYFEECLHFLKVYDMWIMGSGVTEWWCIDCLSQHLGVRKDHLIMRQSEFRLESFNQTPRS